MTTTPEAARAALSDAHLRMLPTEIAAHSLDLAAALADADSALVQTVDQIAGLHRLAENYRTGFVALAETLEKVVASAIAGDTQTAGHHLGIAVATTAEVRQLPPLADAPTYAPISETWPQAFSPAVEVGTIH